MSENKDTIGKYPFRVEPFQEDVTGHLAWRNFCNLLLRCANLHAASLHLGYKQMIEQRRVWVLARLSIQMDAMPLSEEYFNIHTWFSDVYKQFSNREYQILSPDEKLLGCASSVWSLINVDTRQAVDISRLASPEMLKSVVNQKVGIHSVGRVKVIANSPVCSIVAQYSDLDINGHVNSISYLSHALNLFPLSFHQQHPLHRIEITYSAEVFAGETMHYYISSENSLFHNIEVRKNIDSASEKSIVVCRLRLVFR